MVESGSLLRSYRRQLLSRVRILPLRYKIERSTSPWGEKSLNDFMTLDVMRQIQQSRREDSKDSQRLIRKKQVGNWLKHKRTPGRQYSESQEMSLLAKPQELKTINNKGKDVLKLSEQSQYRKKETK